MSVKKIETLSLSKDIIVQQTLKRCCKEIEPIMLRRKWTVGTLMEFYPSDTALLGLNVNRGQIIKVRCRLPTDKNSFYEYNHIIGTILHELAHIEIANHGPKFQKLWDDLWTEYENNTDGNVNRNFNFEIGKSCGQKLSTLRHNPINVRESKKLAAKAAENRKRIQTLLPRGGHRVGGHVGGKRKEHSTPKYLAKQAALKRFSKKSENKNI